jgi:hypothetical protein
MRRIIVLAALALAVMPTAAEAAQAPDLRSKDLKFSNLNFGNEPGAGCSSVLLCDGYVTVSFTGSEPFTLNYYVVTGKVTVFGLTPFSDSTCVFRIYEPGETCTIGVRFNPTATFPPATGELFGLTCVDGSVGPTNVFACRSNLRGHA